MANNRAELTISRHQVRQRLLAGVLCAIFLLQAIIPIGYMPGRLASGTLLQLCPQGISAALMAVLHGSHHENKPESSRAKHNHHAHHDYSADLPVVIHDGLAEVHSGMPPVEDNPQPDHDDGHAQWQNECSYGVAAPGVFTFAPQFTDRYFLFSGNNTVAIKIADTTRKPVSFQRLPRAPPETMV